jgi:hypothetical protein
MVNAFLTPTRTLFVVVLLTAAKTLAQSGCPSAGCGAGDGLAPVVDGSNATALLDLLNRTDNSLDGNQYPSLDAAWQNLGGDEASALANSSCGCFDGCCSQAPIHDGCCSCPQCRGRLMGFEFFGEYLYLRPRDAEVAYAVPIDGPITPTLGNGIQIGPTRVTDIEHRGSFRVGLSAVSTICGRITGQWAHFESRDTDSFSIASPDVIRSLVTHPLGVNAASDGLQTSADYDIDFDLIDLAVQSPILRGPCWSADWIWGIRYGQLSQQFSSQLALNGETSVDTDIAFNGLGPRVGLHGQRNLGFGNLYMFSRGEASFLVGSFDATYVQEDAFSGVVVDSSWEAGRIVPQLEMELGVGCASPGGRVQIRAGYLISAWFNAVRTNEFINAVQLNNPDGLGEGITFDGLVARAEVRF